jgi:hypothetical protein
MVADAIGTTGSGCVVSVSIIGGLAGSGAGAGAGAGAGRAGAIACDTDAGPGINSVLKLAVCQSQVQNLPLSKKR